MRFLDIDGQRGSNETELDFAMIALARQDPSVVDLSLSWARIGDEGCNLLARALRKNHILRKLDLYQNDIGPDGATALSMGLLHNQTLRELNLDWNCVEESGCAMMIHALQGNSALTKLSLEYNRVGQDNLDKVENLMYRNQQYLAERESNNRRARRNKLQDRERIMSLAEQISGAPIEPSTASQAGGAAAGLASQLHSNASRLPGGDGASVAAESVAHRAEDGTWKPPERPPRVSKSVGSRFFQAFVTDQPRGATVHRGKGVNCWSHDLV